MVMYNIDPWWWFAGGGTWWVVCTTKGEQGSFPEARCDRQVLVQPHSSQLRCIWSDQHQDNGWASEGGIRFKSRSSLHSLCLSTLQHPTPSGGIHSHGTLASQPQLVAYLSPDSSPSPTMRRFLTPTFYGVLTLPRKHPFQ
ncbi:hypothetical protein ATANTOWER_016916 [Ataeniobius toweri]|uniref:Uncharacterized protein n=1 Tax=Ataeniobius toweri TaxID=208326 RepID=A0ABU7CHY4_9TELE|nr:hypothetical protein [Ataeniobius toweri]